MLKIFISYRRADSQTIADRIQERLASAFGAENVFQDVLGISYGADFREVLQHKVQDSDVLLVIIGTRWATVKDVDENTGLETSQLRLFNEDDFVRIEVETGLLNKRVLVIPILVNDARMPHERDLPASLRPLMYRNAIAVRNNPYFNDDITRLIAQLKGETLYATRTSGRRRVSLTAIIASLAIFLAVVFGVILLTTQLSGNQGLTQPSPTHVPETFTPISTPVVPAFVPTNVPPGFNRVLHNADWYPVKRSFGNLEMVLVPSGCFMMGVNNGDSDERPVHQQCFDQPFWIGRYEVTNAQFGSSGRWADSNLPRESVSWADAKLFCERAGGRLPTEREWEYAARGPDNLIYPWGNQFDGFRLNFCDVNCSGDQRNPSYNDGYAGTAPVGSYPSGVSWAGAFDMSGNVWEWVSTIYADYFLYPYNSNDGRESSIDNGNTPRGLRGGSWLRDSVRATSPFRNYSISNPISNADGIGFRCARDFQPGDINS
jgi:formylglycine-generating enzyme required for sulfatase activity